MAFGEKPEPLEHRTIAETNRVLDQHSRITILVLHVLSEAVGDMLDAPASRGIVEHVDDRPVNIRDGDPALAAPDSPGSEYELFLDVPQGEDRALAFHRLPPEWTRGKDDNVPKDLLKKFAENVNFIQVDVLSAMTPDTFVPYPDSIRTSTMARKGPEIVRRTPPRPWPGRDGYTSYPMSESPVRATPLPRLRPRITSAARSRRRYPLRQHSSTHLRAS